MTTYNVTNRLSSQAKKEIERVIRTHENYSKSYFYKPEKSADGRRRSERRFEKNNPDVAFLKNGSLIVVNMRYSESCNNCYYSCTITKDDYYKEQSASNPITKTIKEIKSLLK